MPIRGVTLNTSTGSTAVSVTPISGTTTGDIVVVIINWNDGASETVVDNNGATPFTPNLNPFRNNGTAGHVAAVFSRRLQAGDPGTYNFTLSGSQRWTCVAITFSNPHPTDIYDVAPASGNSIAGTSSNPVTVPAITTLNANAIHFSVLCTDGINNSVSATPAGYTTLIQGGEKLICVTYKIIPTPGSTGTTQFSDSLVVTKTGLSFSVRLAATVDLVGTVAGNATVTASLTAAISFTAVISASASLQGAMVTSFVPTALMGLLLGGGYLHGSEFVAIPVFGHRTRILF